MRLLERKDTGEFSLTKDLVRNIPAYAILSHTWGAEDQEVTFKDSTEASGKSKAGYHKIRFCGDQAARDGCRYIWVDTCCIDKSNNAELSEALNSMYRWYRNAARCYVYLADVSIYNLNPPNGSSQSGDETFGKVDGLPGAGHCKSSSLRNQSSSSLSRASSLATKSLWSDKFTR